MIEKFRKIQDSWLMKAVLILTALSFMSLFGMSGYIDSASKNKTIIRVDDTKVSQNEIMGLYNQDVQTAKSLFGESFEIDESLKNSILQGIVQRELNNIIIRKTANQEGLDISNDLLKKVIQSQREFLNEKGQFDISKFRRLLAASRQSEQSYINTLKLDMQKQYMITNLVKNINTPEVAKKYLAKTANLKKTFQYIKIEPANLPINRKISADELEQYYMDFASEFVAPEVRDVSYIFIPTGKDYDKTAQTADKIEDAIGGGLSFVELSKNFNAPILKVIGLNEYGELKSLGNSDKNLVQSQDFTNAAFSYNKGEISQVIEADNGFFVVQVDNVVDSHPKPIESVRAEIEKMWKISEQNAIAQEIINDVNHDLEQGDKLPAIANRFSLNLKTTAFLKKSDDFENIGSATMEDLFKETIGTAKTIDIKSGKIIVVPVDVMQASGALDNLTLQNAQEIFAQEVSQNLINAYGREYKTRVKYKYLGMNN